MAKPTTLNFANFKIWVEDPDSPNSFVAPCGFTQKALTIDATTSDFNVPDCDDPEAPAWTAREVTALSATVTGQGVMAMESLSLWRDWALSGASRAIRVELDAGVPNGGGYYMGDGILQSLGHSVALGADGNKVQLPVNIISDGEWTWVEANI
jgi:hypothetical protein